MGHVCLEPVRPPAPLDGIGWCTHEVNTPWPHMPSLIPVGSGYRTILPTAMIRHMVGSWRDSLPPHERCPAWRPIP